MFISPETKLKIKELGNKYDLKLILFFGSYASGRNHENSDLDIAVLGKKPLGPREFLEIHADLANVFGNTQECELDVSSLHRADPLFCYEVAKNSQLLFGGEDDYNNFRAYAFSYYFDSKDLFRLERKLIEKSHSYFREKYASQR